MMNDNFFNRTDLAFSFALMRDDFKKLRPQEKLSITDCHEDIGKLKEKMRRYGAPKGLGYRVEKAGKITFICCYAAPFPARKLSLSQRKTRSVPLADVIRRRTVEAKRTPWVRTVGGDYECRDQEGDQTFWEIRRNQDKIWPWTILRNGIAVMKSRTIYDAKAEASKLK